MRLGVNFSYVLRPGRQGKYWTSDLSGRYPKHRPKSVHGRPPPAMLSAYPPVSPEAAFHRPIGLIATLTRHSVFQKTALQQLE